MSDYIMILKEIKGKSSLWQSEINAIDKAIKIIEKQSKEIEGCKNHERRIQGKAG